MKILLIIVFMILPMRCKAQKKAEITLAIAGQAAAWADMVTTAQFLDQGYPEADPIARPITELNRPEYYAAGSALTGCVSLLGIAMLHSKRFHRAWKIPQMLQIGVNFGFATWNVHLLRGQ